MQKLRVFLNEPNGKTCGHFKEMLPRLGEKLGLEVETVARPRAEYQTMAYAELGLPRAPAIMLGGEVMAEGRDLEEAELEKLIRRQLAQK